MKSRIIAFFKPKPKYNIPAFSPLYIKNFEEMKRECELIEKNGYTELDTKGMKEAFEKAEKAEGTAYYK